ncbi:MAG TPA: cation:proton antiporter [Usitatibacter sp.]|nr:cation:proton antiporter [Usitatibacter sp.]
MTHSFLPSVPFQFSYPLLFAVLLVAGMLGGEMARAARLPRIIGYVLVGMVFAPLANAMSFLPLIDSGRIFLDLALGLVLFDLGRRMDLQWMKREWSLAATGLAESVLAFGAVFVTLLWFDVAAVKAGIAAAIAMATAPAVVLLVVQDTRAEGQVTERSLNIVALNNLLASIVTTILLASAHLDAKVDVEMALLHPAYLFLGSLALGAAIASVARLVARTVEKTKDLHFTLIAGMVVGAVGLAIMLKLSVILALLAFGLFSRNDARSHDLLNVNLGASSRLLYIVLFVITGASLPPQSLVIAGGAGIALACARLLGKFLGVLLLAPFGGLRWRQAVGLGLALAPMSTFALLLQHDVTRQFPEFSDLSAILVGAIFVMEFVGPVALQAGLRLAGETAPDDDVGTTTGRHVARIPGAEGMR